MGQDKPKAKRSTPDRYRTVNGVNAINMNKFLEFITGEKSVNYGWDDSTKGFVFKVKKEFGTDEALKSMTRKEMLENFEQFFGAKIKLVDY